MKNILITGASRGIGYETALQLAKDGHTVWTIARSEQNLEKLKSEAPKDRIKIISADLTTSESIELIQNELKEINGIDVLINNAGMVLNKPFMDTSDQEWKDIFDINFFAPVQLIKALKPLLIKNSHIVNIGSMGGFQGSDKFPGLSAYSAAKGALAILTESLSAEFSSDHISVNCLCLGAVQTEMLAEAFPGYQAPVSPDEMGSFIKNFALTAHKFMNGKVIPVSLNNPD